MSNTKNTITQEYDALNRIYLHYALPMVVGEIAALSCKATYPEDRDGLRKEMIPKYNKGGALFSLRMDGAEYVKEVAYNARGQRILIAMGNSIMTRYAYDPKTFRVLRQRSALYTHSGHTYTPNAGVRQDMQYTYDLEGTITSMNDAAPANTYAQGPGDLLRVFTHDPLRRLLSATGRETSNVYTQPSWDLNIRTQDYTKTNTYTRRYEYDKIGNMQQLKHVANGHNNQDFYRDYSYGSANNKLTAFTVNSTTFANQYDASGNLTKEGESRYYEWGANDKLAVFKNQAGTSTPSVYTNYFYNAQGERIKKHTRKGNKVTVTFYMDGGMFETSYVKPTGGSIDNNRFYNTIKISDNGALVATIRVGNNVDDTTFAIKYIVGDHLNNSTAVLKTTGSLINREEYYPFGETSFGGFQYKRYRYNGKEKDEESGLYEYGQRYYAPWLYRFVSVDPVAEKFGDLSSYNYAGNKPITKRDQEGLQEEGRRESPQDGDKGKKQSKDVDEKGDGGETINIAPLPENLQQEIDDALDQANKDGIDIEINVHQTESGYSIDIQRSSRIGDNLNDGGELNLPKDPELAIRDQQAERSSGKSSGESDNPNSGRVSMDPIPTLPAKPLTPDAPADDRWKLVETIVEGYAEKSKRLFSKGGKQLAKAAKFFKSVSKGLGYFGAGIAVYDAIKEFNEKGVNWKTVTKGVLAFGLGVGSTIWAPLALPAFIYFVADYFGLVDKTLDGIEYIVEGIGDFFQDVAYKTRKGLYDMEQGLRKGWRPVW